MGFYDTDTRGAYIQASIDARRVETGDMDEVDFKETYGQSTHAWKLKHSTGYMEEQKKVATNTPGARITLPEENFFSSIYNGNPNMAYTRPNQTTAATIAGTESFNNEVIEAVLPIPFLETGQVAKVAKKAESLFTKGVRSSASEAVTTVKNTPVAKLTDVPKINKGPISAPEDIPQTSIDWGKWNSSIPHNKELMKEYINIEKMTKDAGDWMKNADGTPFKGTPEQFVQQRSSNFREAFPEGHEEVYRGGANIGLADKHDAAVFTANKDLAKTYSGNSFIDNTPENMGEHGLFTLAHPKSSNSLTFDAMEAPWTSIPLKGASREKTFIKQRLEFQKKQLIKQQKWQDDAVWNAEGKFWQLPDDESVKMSDFLYRKGTKDARDRIERTERVLNNFDNLISDPDKYKKMADDLGDVTITDDIANYAERKNLDYIKINNIEDGGFGDVSMVNHKKGNFLKSLIGNNGMFNMNDPNVFKAITGVTLSGLAGKGLYNYATKEKAL